MVVTDSGWILDLERGPDWLFVRVTPPNEPGDLLPDLAQAIWDLLQMHFTYRLVLELDLVDELSSHLIGQIIILCDRVERHGGMLRLCGLNELCQQSLELCALGSRLRSYDTRAEAVLGPRPMQPR